MLVMNSVISAFLFTVCRLEAGQVVALGAQQLLISHHMHHHVRRCASSCTLYTYSLSLYIILSVVERSQRRPGNNIMYIQSIIIYICMYTRDVCTHHVLCNLYTNYCNLYTNYVHDLEYIKHTYTQYSIHILLCMYILLLSLCIQKLLRSHILVHV